MSYVAVSMGTMREDMSASVSSKKLDQKQEPDTRLDKLETNLKANHQPAPLDKVSCEQEKRVTPIVKSEVLQYNQEEASSLICDKITSELHQFKHRDDVYQEYGDDSSPLDEVSQLTKREPEDLHHWQSSDAGHDVSKSHVEERSHWDKNEMDSDVLLQKSSSEPRVLAPQSIQSVVSNITSHDNALEKLQPRRNQDTGVQRSQSDQGISSSTVPGGFCKVPKAEPDSLRLEQSPDSVVMYDGGNVVSVKKEMASDSLFPVQSLKREPISQSDQQKLTNSIETEKTLVKFQPRWNTDAGDCGEQSDQGGILCDVPEKLLVRPNEELNANELQNDQCLDAENLAIVSKDAKHTSVKNGKVPKNLVQITSTSIGVPISQSAQSSFSYSKKFEKIEKLQPRRNPDPGVQGSQSDAKITPSKVLERGLDDGFNWRKYGQKLVKGNTFVRGYYRCTYPNCEAKKQVERSHVGYNTDVNYLGNHQHPKPHSTSHVTSGSQVRKPEIPVVTPLKAYADSIISHGDAHQHVEAIVTSRQPTVFRSFIGAEGTVYSENDVNKHNKDNDVYPDSKRWKREIVDEDVPNKPNGELRHVVKTLSAVDLVNDGYRWRKYGQKLVKGNPNPRSYYRCSNAGCPVKKHVERASHDPNVVITMYEGQHVHDMPPSVTFNQNTTGADANVTIANTESIVSISGENNPVGLEVAVQISAN